MITEYGKLLRIIRVNTGEKELDMAKKLHMSASYLSAIENGKRAVPMDMEHYLRKAYPLTEVDIDNLRKAAIADFDSFRFKMEDYSYPQQKLILVLAQGISDELAEKLLAVIDEETK